MFIAISVFGLSLVSNTITILFLLVVFLPYLSVTTRRLHDIDRSGWFQIIGLVPIIGLVLLYFLAKEGKDPNRFGNRDPFHLPYLPNPSIPESEENQVPVVASVVSNTERWIMETKKIPYWKFIFGANFFKKYQLDRVERDGNIIRVKVLNGNEYSFEVGNFKANFIKTKEGNRDFTIQTISGPRQRVTFRETLLQMPEEWWDELSGKIGASESGLSKVLHAVKDSMELLK